MMKNRIANLNNIRRALRGQLRRLTCPDCQGTVPLPHLDGYVGTVALECAYCPWRAWVQINKRGAVSLIEPLDLKRSCDPKVKPNRAVRESDVVNTRRPRCAIDGCKQWSDGGRLCEGHQSCWRAAGKPNRDAWILKQNGAAAKPPTRKPKPAAGRTERRPRPKSKPRPAAPRQTHTPMGPCQVADCPRPGVARGLCRNCHKRWCRSGRPNLKSWLGAGGPVPRKRQARVRPCRVPGCAEKCGGEHHGGLGLCRRHHRRWHDCGAPDLPAWVAQGGPSKADFERMTRNLMTDLTGRRAAG